MLKKVIRNRKFLPVFISIILALIAVAVIVPTSILAAGNDTPQQFTLWHPTSSTSPDDASITLRFAFTIDTNTSGNVGIVYSFTNHNPTVGGSGCTKKTATVYSAGHYLTWHSSPINPGSGRRWAWVETNTIQKAHYGDTIYVRAYIQTSSGTTYSSVMNTSVWEAFIADFNDANFGGGNVTTDLYAAAAERYYYLNGQRVDPVIPTELPPVNPTVGQHPRVLFTESDILGIQTAFQNAPLETRTAFLNAISAETFGILANGQFDSGKLMQIQEMALYYQMTGDNKWGYLSVYAIKNYLKTMVTWDINDRCRAYGFVMYTAACVYDWCHDLLTETDKAQIVAGVQHKCCEAFTNGATITHPADFRMEIDFPPAVPGVITSHNAELQLLRDYLSFAIAIYDEYPGWWDYIGARFYEEYVPVRNEFYKAGMYPQGVSTYVRIRFTSDIYSAALIKAMTGSIPYDEAGMQQVARTIYSYQTKKVVENEGKPNERTIYYGFADGDDEIRLNEFLNYGRVALISSFLFEDETMRKQLEDFKESYTKFDSGSYTVFACPGEYLIFSSNGVEAASNRHAGMPLLLYNGGWLGQMISRNTWDEWQWAFLMKIGGRATGNHDHFDAGSFQIFFKENLAPDTGVYDKYGDDHHKCYHQATIAHNSLLIYNPNRSSDDRGYYTGGQRLIEETGNFNDGGDAAWLTSDRFLTGTVTGMRYQYGANTNVARYGYIAGDITPAYDSDTVDEVNRRMLVDYWGSNDVVYFFVFDKITADNSSYKKTFLLHTPTEPSMINSKTYQVINGNGKMVLQNVIGNNVTITKVGGPNKNYWVNHNGGSNYVQLNSEHTQDDGNWGRLEVSPATGNKTDVMVNVICVCSKTNNSVPTATAITTDSVAVGTQIGNAAAVFIKNKNPQTSSFSFTTTGTQVRDYFVSGVASGTWTVKRNGTTVGTYEAKGGLLFFEADAGTIQLIPASLTATTVSDSLGNGSWSSVSFSSLH